MNALQISYGLYYAYPMDSYEFVVLSLSSLWKYVYSGACFLNCFFNRCVPSLQVVGNTVSKKASIENENLYRASV